MQSYHMILSADCALVVFIFERFHRTLFLSSGWIPTKRDGSHLIFTMVSRGVSWMGRQNLERPRAAVGWVGQCVAVLHVGPRSSPRDPATDPLWFLLIPSLSPRRDSPLGPLRLVPPVHREAVIPSFLRSGFRRTRHCLHHKRPPPSDRPPPPILVEGAAYDLAMRLQQHMPWYDDQTDTIPLVGRMDDRAVQIGASA